MNFHRIPTKLGTAIHLNEPFMYNKCQLDRSMGLHFMVDFEKFAKEEKNPNIGRSYLGNGWSDFLQIWNVNSYLATTSVTNLISIG